MTTAAHKLVRRALSCAVIIAAAPCIFAADTDVPPKDKPAKGLNLDVVPLISAERAVHSNAREDFSVRYPGVLDPVTTREQIEQRLRKMEETIKKEAADNAAWKQIAPRLVKTGSGTIVVKGAVVPKSK